MSTKQYNAIQSLIQDNLYRYHSTGYLVDCVYTILLSKLDTQEQQYMNSKITALFNYYNTPDKLSNLFANWYVNKEGPSIFDEYTEHFINLIDFIITNNEIFVPNISSIRMREMESMLNGN